MKFCVQVLRVEDRVSGLISLLLFPHTPSSQGEGTIKIPTMVSAMKTIPVGVSAQQGRHPWGGVGELRGDEQGAQQAAGPGSW